MQKTIPTMLICLFVASCTLSEPLNPTPTSSPIKEIATETALPIPTNTLLPTATQFLTNTPANNSLPTAIPLNNNGDGGGSFGAGSVDANNPAQNNVAPIGVRTTATPSQSNGSSGFIQIDLATQATTPTVPPRAMEQYTAQVNASNKLVVHYNIMMTGGIIVVWVLSPSGDVIWQQEFTQTIDDEAEITVPESGEYKILAYFENLRGNYSLDFGIR